jgi:hypothetical protein
MFSIWFYQNYRSLLKTGFENLIKYWGDVDLAIGYADEANDYIGHKNKSRNAN